MCSVYIIHVYILYYIRIDCTNLSVLIVANSNNKYYIIKNSICIVSYSEHTVSSMHDTCSYFLEHN